MLHELSRKRILSTTLVLVLSGCATTPQNKPDDDKLIYSKVDLILEDLAKVAIKTKEMTLEHQSAMLQLENSSSEIQEVTQDRMKIALGMDKPITFDNYRGDMRSPVDVVAKLSGYLVEVEGVVPKEPVWVVLDAGLRTADSWIRNIAVQSDPYGVDIDIYQNKNALLSDGSPNGTEPNGLIVIKYKSKLYRGKK